MGWPVNVDTNRKRQRHFDRVTLDAATLARLDTWIGQVEAVKVGVLVSRKDVLNWLVMNLPERLSATQEKGLAEEFYSELRYLQFAARAIKAAEVRGERLTLKDLAERAPQAKEPAKRRVRKPRDEAVGNVTLAAQETTMIAGTSDGSAP